MSKDTLTSAEERKRLTDQIDCLKMQFNDVMRGRVVPNAKAVKIRHEIDDLNDRIYEIDREVAKRLAFERVPIEESLEIISLPLLADVMNDIVAGVDAMLRRNGCHETAFGVYSRQIQKAALAMVSTLDHADEGMPPLLEIDDTLIDAVKKKLMSFIKQHLNITK